ncbi:hypothetical protein Hanom_Chr04g00332571 [Helianthus anomalus]
MGIYTQRDVRGYHFSSTIAIFLSSSRYFFKIFKFFKKLGSLFSMAEEHQEDIPGEEGPVPVLRWDPGLFEQITRSFRFPPEWDAKYPGQNQMAADAPPGYITLFEDFFHQGNFRLPATNFLAHILQFYGFHIS